MICLTRSYRNKKRKEKRCKSHGKQYVAIATERAETGLMFLIPPFQAAAATVSCSIWNDSKVQSLVGVGRHRIQLAKHQPRNVGPRINAREEWV